MRVDKRHPVYFVLVPGFCEVKQAIDFNKIHKTKRKHVYTHNAAILRREINSTSTCTSVK